jgi:hypothetical protein
MPTPIARWSICNLPKNITSNGFRKVPRTQPFLRCRRLCEVGCGAANCGGHVPGGTVEMHQVQAAYIGSASGGAGTLFFNGPSYPFDTGSVGIGGIGHQVSRRPATCIGCRLLRSSPAPPVKAAMAYTFVKMSGGDMWLKNEQGVVLHLRAKREGLMLSLGGDVVDIEFGQ